MARSREGVDAMAGWMCTDSRLHFCWGDRLELHRLCRQHGLHQLAERVAAGEFDATKEESDEWAASASGQEIAKELSPAMREIIGLKLNH